MMPARPGSSILAPGGGQDQLTGARGRKSARLLRFQIPETGLETLSTARLVQQGREAGQFLLVDGPVLLNGRSELLLVRPAGR
jgi:hypothetical protein